MRVVALAMLALAALWTAGAHAAPVDRLKPLEFTVDGVKRTALLSVPAGEPPGGGFPLVFVFHGHGGGSRNVFHEFDLDREWPEALAIYPQGLDTPGQLTDLEGLQTGWQRDMGDQGDRDLHFFDAMLGQLQKDYRVDPKRVYCTGHSNGAGFTYLLWLARPDVFAAVAPCSGAARYIAQVKPKPAMILAGKSDPIVKFEWTQRMIARVQQINGCEATGTPWQTVGTQFPSATGTPLVTYLYEGGHMMDPAEPGLIVRFFKEHPAVAP